MDFLRNLASGVYNTVNKIGSSIGSFFSNLGGGNQAANAGMAFPLLPGVGLSGPNQSVAPNMTVAPNPQTGDPGGPGYAYNGGAISINSPVMRANANQAAQQAQEVYALRPSTSRPVSSTGQVSNRQVGEPYYNDAGVLVIPRQGFSGATGGGGEGFDSVPPQGTQGTSGGGESAFTGLLAGAGTGPTPSGSTDEEVRKREARTAGTTMITPETAGAVNAITSPIQRAQLRAPSMPENIDIGYLQKVQETINNIASSGSALSPNDRQSLINTLGENLLAAKSKLDQQMAIPENPVLDTPEQLAFLNASGDPFGVKQAMDDFRAQNTTLGGLHVQRNELMKNIQALNEAYRPIIKDIKNNPDLPKALARRRLEDLAETQKEVMQGFLDQLTIVGQQIDDQNQLVNRQFQIAQMAQTQQNQAQDNIRAQLQMMINSGAIAGFRDGDLQAYANALGIPVSALKQAKEDALKPKTDVSTVGTSETGYYTVVRDEETGKTISSTLLIPGTGKATSSDKKLTTSEINSLNTQYEDELVFDFGETQAGAETKISGLRARSNLIDDIQSGFTDLQQLRKAYPEIPAPEIISLLDQYRTDAQTEKKGLLSTVGSFFGSLFGR